MCFPGWSAVFSRQPTLHHDMSGIDAETLRARYEEYLASEAFAVVEEDRLATLPEAFQDGSYLWKDCEWIVRWYLRRPLDGQSNPQEETFRHNRMREIETAIDEAIAVETLEARFEALLALDGVDVPLASAFLQFIDPDSYTAIAEPCWDALVLHGDLSGDYPDPVRPSAYRQYLESCRDLAEQADLRTVDIGRALWRLGRDFKTA